MKSLQTKIIFVICLLLYGIATCRLHAQNNGIRLTIANTKTEPPVALFQLEEVTIVAGENPALRLIDSLIQHRKDNNPDHLQSYSYSLYDKMVFTVDTNIHSPFDTILRKSDLMVMETVSEVKFKSPDKKLQQVKAVKVAGMRDPVFMYLTDRLQSGSIYEETVELAGSSYVNPISKMGKKKYEYYLASTQPLGKDTLFVITFRPAENATVSGLTGRMTVHSEGWAVEDVTLAPDEQSGLYKVEIQQRYGKVNGYWFPKQYEINLFFPSVAMKIDSVELPMLAIGKSHLTDIRINPPLDDVRFSELALDIDDEASNRSNAYWERHRSDSLSARTEATYLFLDSITRGNDLFERSLSFYSRLLEDQMIPVGPMDIDIANMLRISGMRGWYFGLQLVTNDRFSRHFRLKGFGGYWTHLKDFDYGLEGKWLISRRYQTELGVSFAHKSSPMGEFGGFSEGVSPLAEKEYKYTIYENVLARGTQVEVFFNSRFARHFKAFVTLGNYQKIYYKQVGFRPTDSMPMTRYSNAEIKLRFAYNERFATTIRGIESLGSDYPVVWLSYMHSFKGVLGGQYEYDRVKFQLAKDFQTLYHGAASVLFQLGYASSGSPLVETFDLLGSYYKVGIYSPGSFATMREEEFFCDRFVALYLSYDFQGTLWNTNSDWFRPQLTLATNMGWGDMRRADAFPDKNFKTMEKGYFESGFVVKGLLCLSGVSLGTGAFYRYGPYAFHRFWDDIAWKVSVNFDF